MHPKLTLTALLAAFAFVPAATVLHALPWSASLPPSGAEAYEVGYDDPCGCDHEVESAPLALQPAFAAGAAEAGDPMPANGALSGNDIWLDYAVAPDTHPNLPNNAFAGYRRSEVPVPVVPVVVDATAHGVVGDGVTDNTRSLQEALEAGWRAGGGAVLLPAGDVFVDSLVFMKHPGVVLRGRGPDLTRLVFRRSLKSVIGVDQTGSGTSRWSWQGGLIWISPEAQVASYDLNDVAVEKPYGSEWTVWWSGSPWRGPRLANVTNTPLRGSWTVEVDDASALRPGEHYLMAWENVGLEGAYSLAKHIAGHPLMAGFDWAGSTGLFAREQWQWPVEILAIDGNTVHLAQPTRIDIRAEWTVGFEPIGPVIEDVGIEDLSVVMEGTPLVTAHNFYDGWNAVFFTKALNCWVRNVDVLEAENAILSRSTKNLTMENVSFTGVANIHHGITQVRSHDSILQDFHIDQPIRHGISVEDLATGNVSRDGLMVTGTFDSHRFMSFDTVRTDITLTNTGGPGGASDFGPFVGKNVVHWNVELLQNKGEFVYQPDAHSMGALVGIRGADADLSCAWAMVCGDKGNLIADHGLVPDPVDLFLAQLAHREATDRYVSIDRQGLHFLPAGDDLTLRAIPRVGAGRTVAQVEYFANGVSWGSALAAPYEVVVSAVPAGRFDIVAVATDDLGQTVASAPWSLPVGARRQVSDQDPAIVYGGGGWSTQSNALDSGGTSRRITQAGDSYLDFVFTGTRIRIYVSAWDFPNVEVFLDDYATPVGTVSADARTKWRYLVWDSGPLDDGTHALRLVPTFPNGKFQLDHFEIEETAPAPATARPDAVIAATPALGEAPLTVDFDASGSTAAVPVDRYLWNFGDGTATSGPLAQRTYALPGAYRARLGVHDTVGLADQDSRVIRVLHPAAGPPGGDALIVDWGDEVIDQDINFRDGNEQTEVVDLDGDGADDSRTGYPFSLATPFAAQGAHYFLQPLYGGAIGELTNSTDKKLADDKFKDFAFSDTLSVRYQTSAGQVSKLWMAFFVQKADFYNGGADHPVEFRSGSFMRLGNVSKFDALGQVRWLVRDGTAFYVSEATITPDADLTFASDGDDGNWAPFDPAANMDFDEAAAVFASMNFTDITAAGIYVDGGVPLDGKRRWLTFGRLEVGAFLSGAGSYQTWLEANFAPEELGNPTLEATVWGPEADDDSDGLATIAEHYLGTNVRETSSLPLTVERTVDGTTLTYPRAKGVDEVTATPFWSTNLVDWYDTGFSVDVLLGEEGSPVDMMEASLITSEGDLFLRLEFEKID